MTSSICQHNCQATGSEGSSVTLQATWMGDPSVVAIIQPFKPVSPLGYPMASEIKGLLT